MVITETITLNGTEYIRNYSDTGHYIERDGVKYGEAIDPVGTDRVYTETEELIEYHGKKISKNSIIELAKLAELSATDL